MRADMLAAGADDLVDFPIQPQTFRDACLRLVESGRREAPRVLIVDDDPSIRMICREVLELGGYQVRDAGSAPRRIAEARRFRPDMIVLDVLMPGTDGYRTAEMLRSDPSRSPAPIMFLSAKGDTADKVRAFRQRRRGLHGEAVRRRGAARSRRQGARSPGARARRVADHAVARRRRDPGRDRAAHRRASAVACYLDLDNLKAFNDYYGYAKANAVIRQTGDVIRQVVQRCGTARRLHRPHRRRRLRLRDQRRSRRRVCHAICDHFDHLISLYYDPGDRGRGYIETKDRFGVLRKFPLMSVSVAAISLVRAKTYASLAELAAVGKSTAKAIPGSSYVRDGQTMAAADRVDLIYVRPSATATPAATTNNASAIQNPRRPSRAGATSAVIVAGLGAAACGTDSSGTVSS